MISDEAKAALVSLFQNFEQDEEAYRDDQIREITRNILFWEGKQDIIYDYEYSIWRSSYDAYNQGMISYDEIRDFSRNVNEYRAHGEAIIAALSLEVPKAKFFPKRANNPADIIAARTYSKAAEMILAHNDGKKMLQKAFFTRYNQHFVAIHSYFKRSKDYGVITLPRYENQRVITNEETCSVCGSEIQSDMQFDMQQESPESMMKFCETCQDIVPTLSEQSEEEIPVQIGEDEVPLGRVQMDVYGPLHVMIPHYVQHLKDSPYLRLSTEHNRSYLEELFEQSDEELDFSPDAMDEREKLIRTGTVANNDELTTLYRWWVRPWIYRNLSEEFREELKTEYPDGLIAFVINDKIAKCFPQRLDKYWAVTRSPISHQIHAAPHGRPMIPIQEMLNDLTHITMETIRHGVSVTFADPEVLSFKKFQQTRATPGNLIQAKPKPGQNLEGAFYQTRHATLSQEVEPFRTWLQQSGQFVTGSLPSIYGGTIDGTRTFSEWESSRQQALQRLSLPWDDVSTLFAEAQLNGVKCLKEHMQEEESYAQKSGSSFIDVFIRQEELSGEIGDVITEIAPQYPTTWAQKRAMLFELLEKQIPEIGGTLFLPENANIVKQLLTMDDIFVPGAADRDVQLLEIADLLKQAPLGEGFPSIMPDSELDNVEIHMETCRNWLNSIEGRDAKENNPDGYYNVLFHFRLHKQMYDQLMAQATENENESNSDPEQATA